MARERKVEPDPRWNALIERVAWIVLLVAVLFALAVRVRVRELPLERDEGEYAYAGQLLLQGVPPYQLAYNMKLPGTYVAYAVILAVFGETPAGIHLGLAVVNVACIVMVFFLGRRLLDAVTGAVAALSYAMLSTSPALQGVSGHATHFVVLCALGGVLLLMRACESNRGRMFLLSGLLFGLAFLMKQPGITFGLFALVYVAWRNFDAGKFDVPALWRQGGALAVGVALPYVLTCLWLWQAGVFKAFLFWTVGYAHEYVTTIPWSLLRESLHVAGGFTLYPTLAFWILAGVGAVAMWWEPRLRGKHFFVMALVVASFAATSAGLYFRPHYFITAAPVLALLGGIAVSRAVQQLLHERSVELFPALATQGVFVLAVGVALLVDGESWFSRKPAELSQRMMNSTIFIESATVADYLRANVAKDARVAVIGSEPQIYFQSGRRSATGYIYMYGLMGVHPLARQMQDELIREVEAARPEWVVYVHNQNSWLAVAGADEHIFKWWQDYWKANYDLVRTVNIHFARREGAPSPGRIAVETTPMPDGMFLILKRKGSAPGS